MLNKLDLKLFELLDSEVNKELSFGCYCKIGSFHRISSNDRYHEWFEIVRDYYKDCGSLLFLDYEIWLEKNIEWHKALLDDITILWHFPTTNEILRYVWDKWNCSQDYKNYCEFYWEFIGIIYEWQTFQLDITKPIQQHTDKQKEELIDFLTLLKW